MFCKKKLKEFFGLENRRRMESERVYDKFEFKEIG
jgi:hypothetical protein